MARTGSRLTAGQTVQPSPGHFMASASRPFVPISVFRDGSCILSPSMATPSWLARMLHRSGEGRNQLKASGLALALATTDCINTLPRNIFAIAMFGAPFWVDAHRVFDEMPLRQEPLRIQIQCVGFRRQSSYVCVCVCARSLILPPSQNEDIFEVGTGIKKVGENDWRKCVIGWKEKVGKEEWLWLVERRR